MLQKIEDLKDKLKEQKRLNSYRQTRTLKEIINTNRETQTGFVSKIADYCLTYGTQSINSDLEDILIRAILKDNTLEIYHGFMDAVKQEEANEIKEHLHITDNTATRVFMKLENPDVYVNEDYKNLKDKHTDEMTDKVKNSASVNKESYKENKTLAYVFKKLETRDATEDSQPFMPLYEPNYSYGSENTVESKQDLYEYHPDIKDKPIPFTNDDIESIKGNKLIQKKSFGQPTISFTPEDLESIETSNVDPDSLIARLKESPVSHNDSAMDTLDRYVKFNNETTIHLSEKASEVISTAISDAQDKHNHSTDIVDAIRLIVDTKRQNNIHDGYAQTD